MARKRNRQRRKVTKPSASTAAPSSPSPSSPPPTRFAWMSSPTLPPLALCALALTAFFPALHAGFVWDDVAFTGADAVQSWSGIAQIWFAPGALSKEGHYWPLVYTTFWLEHKLYGFNPFGFHLVNLILHAAVTVLLWRLLLRLKIQGAWFAAAVFAVHPVHTEAVAWVIGRKDLLAALCFFASALCYIHFVEQRRRRDYLTALALFVAGMLSKSIVVTLPAALLIFHWWRHGGVTDLNRALKTVSPFIVIGVAVAAADWLHYAAREAFAADHTLIERAQIASQALWFYAGKLFWPASLAVIYPHFTVGTGDAVAWAYLTAAVALATALWFARHRLGNGAVAGVAFFAVTLSPVLGFVDFGFMQFSFVADRYQYLAGAGVIVIVTAAAARLLHRLPSAARTTTVAVAALTVLLPLTVLSWQQAGLYKNAGTLFAHIIALNPNARGAHDNYGIYLRDQGRLDEALAAFRVAAEQRPDWVWAHLGMGKTADELGRADAAEKHFVNAVRVAPQSPDALDHLAALRLKQRRYHDALALFEQMTKLQPDNAKFYYGRGIALAGLNRLNEALQSYDRALALNPSLQNARDNRERLLRKIDGE